MIKRLLSYCTGRALASSYRSTTPHWAILHLRPEPVTRPVGPGIYSAAPPSMSGVKCWP